MTSQAKKSPADKQVGTEVAKSPGKPPFPFRTVISLILLAGNFLVAAIYFHVLNI